MISLLRTNTYIKKLFHYSTKTCQSMLQNGLVQKVIPEQKQSYYNHRLLQKNVWDHMIFPKKTSDKDIINYKSFIHAGIKYNSFDLSNYFQFEFQQNYNTNKSQSDYNNRYNTNNYIYTPKYEMALWNFSMSNCLIFGKTNIRLQDVNNLLTLVKFKNMSVYHDVICIDNYRIRYIESLSSNAKYTILFLTDKEYIDHLNFCSTHEQKYFVVKHLIQIMNEVNEELLNHHNYNVLVEYLSKNT